MGIARQLKLDYEASMKSHWQEIPKILMSSLQYLSNKQKADRESTYDQRFWDTDCQVKVSHHFHPVRGWLAVN